MTLVVLKLLVVPVLGVVIGVVRARRGRVRRATVRTGGTATCRAWLGLGTQRPRRGELLLSGSRVTWTARRGGAVVELGGSAVLSVAEAARTDARPDDAVLRLSLPWQATARLRLHQEDAATVLLVLRGSGVTTPADPVRDAGDETEVRYRPRWPLVCLALAGLWLWSGSS